MLRIVSVAFPILAAVLLLAITRPNVEGCAAVPRENGPSISIAEESAIIVWDPVRKVQHFIRRAAFDTKSPDFAFLVPTPTTPQIPFQELEDSTFQAMDQWILPRRVEQTRLKFEPILCIFGCGLKTGSPMLGAAKDVRVLHEQKVGGFDTVVLEADNTGTLSTWLKDNGYSNDPELQSWLFPYIAAKWKITAFKITQHPTTGQLATTKAVRMTFGTDRPFFPYREPEGKPEKKDDDATKTKQKNPHVPTDVDGIWKIESAEGNEKDGVRLQGTKFSFVEGVAVGRYLKDTKYSVDASKEPKWLDVGKMQGIYKLDGDTLHWCRGTTARPGSFDSKEGLLLVLRRDAKAERDAIAAEVASKDWNRLHGGSRLLRVFFVSNARMEGQLGNTAWNAKVNWSDQLTDKQRRQLAKETGVPEAQIPAKAWMTTFEDRASPRPGTDEVYFDPAKDQTPIRPEFIHYNDVWIPMDVAVLFITLAVLGILAIKGAGWRLIAPSRPVPNPPPPSGSAGPPWTAS